MEAVVATLVGALVAVLELVTAPIPFLASSGLLLLVFAGLWVAVGYAVAREPGRLDAAWTRLRSWPLPAQLVAWLLLLPVVAGVWVWRTGWPRVARVVVMAGIAGWNLLVFLPRPA